MRAATALLGATTLVASAVTAPAVAEMAERNLYVVLAGRRRAVTDDAAGRKRIEGFLSRIYRGGASSSATRQVLDPLFDPRVRDDLGRIAGLSYAPSYDVELHIADNVDQIWVGEELWLRDQCQDPYGAWERYVVQAGDTLGALARERCMSLDEVRSWNWERFEIWPHAAKEKIVRLGETLLDQWAYGNGLTRLLYHEVGHIGDDAGCATEPLPYGPDGTHFMDEVILPNRAFKEGWANYQEIQAAGGAPDIEIAALDTPQYPLTGDQPQGLKVETAGSTKSMPAYRFLDPAEMIANDYLSNEGLIAVILTEMDRRLPGGRGALERTFVSTQYTACRDIAAFLQAYVQLHPGSREDVADILDRRTAGLMTPEQIDGVLLDGELPYCQAPNHMPRPAPASPSASSLVEVDEADYEALVELYESSPAGEVPVVYAQQFALHEEDPCHPPAAPVSVFTGEDVEVEGGEPAEDEDAGELFGQFGWM